VKRVDVSIVGIGGDAVQSEFECAAKRRAMRAKMKWPVLERLRSISRDAAHCASRAMKRTKNTTRERCESIPLLHVAFHGEKIIDHFSTCMSFFS